MGSKKITAAKTKQYTGTEEAFMSLLAKQLWYKEIYINRAEITQSNAWQIKSRAKKGTLTVDLMENILKAAGYTIVQPVIWEK